MLSKRIITDYVNNLTMEFLNIEIISYVFGDVVKFYVENDRKVYYLESSKSLRFTRYNTEGKNPLPNYVSDGRLSLKLIKRLNKNITIMPIKNVYTLSTDNFSVTDKYITRAVAKLFLMESYLERDFLPCLI